MLTYNTAFTLHYMPELNEKVLKCIGRCIMSPLFWTDASAENAETLKVPQILNLGMKNECGD